MRTTTRHGGAARTIVLVSAVVLALISGVAVASVVGVKPVEAAPAKGTTASVD